MLRGAGRRIYIVLTLIILVVMVFLGYTKKQYHITPGVIYDPAADISTTDNMALLSGEYNTVINYKAAQPVSVFVFRDDSGEAFPMELDSAETEYEFSLYLEQFSDKVRIAYQGSEDVLKIESIDFISEKPVDLDWFVYAAIFLLLAVYLYYRLKSECFRTNELFLYAGIGVFTAVLIALGFDTGFFIRIRMSLHGSSVVAALLLSIFAALIVHIVCACLPGKDRPGAVAVIKEMLKWTAGVPGQILSDIDAFFLSFNDSIENDPKARIIVFTVLCGIFLFSRLFLLDKVIYAVNADEIGTGYDALCIKDYGVDRWTTRMPVYFKNYSSGQNALYTYLAAIVFCFTDFSLFALRLPAVICSFFGFVSAFVLAGKLFKKRIYQEVTAIFFIIWPVFLLSERWALESFLLHSLIFASMLFLYLAIDSGKSLWYLASGCAFGISLYTYAIAYVIVPLFLLFTVVYLLLLKKVSVKNIIACAVPFILLGLPLAIEQMVNAGMIAPFSTAISDFFPMRRFRGEEFTMEHVIQNIKICYRLITADDRPYNGSALYGTMYYISVPLIVIGIAVCVKDLIGSIRKKVFEYKTLIIVFFVIAFIESLTVRKLNINRSNEIYFCFLFFAVYGVEYCCEKRDRIRYALIVIYAVSTIAFMHYYYSGGNMDDIWASEAHALLWQPVEIGEAARTITEEYGSTKKLHILDRTDDTVDAQVLLLAAYERVSPYEFNEDHSKNSIYTYGVPESLDTSGNTIYLINKEYEDIIESLSDSGFTIDGSSYDDYIQAIK